MSLLLDALKKAAQEKRNADSAVGNAEAGADAVRVPGHENDAPTEVGYEGNDDSYVYDELELELDDLRNAAYLACFV